MTRSAHLSIPTTAPQPPTASPNAPHRHDWTVESRHSTSDGVCIYVRCDDCGTRRVELQEHPDSPPLACSVEIGSPHA